jgi:hypothetical protein
VAPAAEIPAEAEPEAVAAPAAPDAGPAATAPEAPAEQETRP